MNKVRRSSAENEEVWGTEEDDMTDGDLGYGLGRRPGGIYEFSCFITSKKRSDGKNLSPTPFPKGGEERSEPIFQYSRNKGLQDTRAHGCRASGYRRQSRADSNSELSNEQLRQRLHETLEEVEILKTELEASQRQLEGKEEALKILQSMAVLDKATSHTQTVLQKTIEQKRSLEKEINALQWEMEFDQDRFKNIEESWIQKYDRLNCDNAVLRENLKVKTEEIKMLKSQNAGLCRLCPKLGAICIKKFPAQLSPEDLILNQRYLEALAMLDIKQQRTAEDVGREDSGFPEVSSLELEILQKSKEEAHITADAFRIAFEQQLMRKNDQALRLAAVDECGRAATWISGQHWKEDGCPSQRRKKTLRQKLLGILPSENSSKKTEDQEHPQGILKMLIDLLNDKEEALAHQRKVSYMLARALEGKDCATKNKDRVPPSQNSPFTTAWHEASECCVLRDPAHSNGHVSDPVGCICSVQHPQRDSDCSRTLKRSSSLPSNVF